MATTEMLCFKVYTKGDFFFRIYIESGYIRRFVNPAGDLESQIQFEFESDDSF